MFMEVSADNSFPDFRSPFPAPRSPFPDLVTSPQSNIVSNFSRLLQGGHHREEVNGRELNLVFKYIKLPY